MWCLRARPGPRLVAARPTGASSLCGCLGPRLVAVHSAAVSPLRGVPGTRVITARPVVVDPASEDDPEPVVHLGSI